MPPGCLGAGRPEKRVTARSGAPQKKCTGLHLPVKRPRNSLEHAIGLHEDAPEAVGVLRVVGAVRLVLVEGQRIGDLVRRRG